MRHTFLAWIFLLIVAKDPYAILRKFHPVERVVEEQSQPLVSGSPKGGMTLHYTYRWIRTFKFPRVSRDLLSTLRKMARIQGTTYDSVGKYMTIRLPNGREGTFDYRTRTLTFDNEPAQSK